MKSTQVSSVASLTPCSTHEISKVSVDILSCDLTSDHSDNLSSPKFVGKLRHRCKLRYRCSNLHRCCSPTAEISQLQSIEISRRFNTPIVLPLFFYLNLLPLLFYPKTSTFIFPQSTETTGDSFVQLMTNERLINVQLMSNFKSLLLFPPQGLHCESSDPLRGSESSHRI